MSYITEWSPKLGFSWAARLGLHVSTPFCWAFGIMSAIAHQMAYPGWLQQGHSWLASWGNLSPFTLGIFICATTLATRHVLRQQQGISWPDLIGRTAIIAVATALVAGLATRSLWWLIEAIVLPSLHR